MLDSLERIQPKLVSEQTALTERKNRLNEQLLAADLRSSEAKSAVDQRLMIAVYLMIATIATAFITLKLLPSEIASAVVHRRTMIELLSMGFLLLTIIVLATGGNVDKPAVGTLLGTIAGYIFGAGKAAAPSFGGLGDQGNHATPGATKEPASQLNQ